jgi:hypothetical protein
MILNGFAGRTVCRVERQRRTLKVVFEDGGYLYVLAKGPEEAWLKITCMDTRCKPPDCVSCRGLEAAASD